MSSWLSRMTVAKKAWAVVIMTLVAIAALGGVSISSTRRLGATAHELEEFELTRYTLWAQVQREMLTARRNEKDFFLRGLTDPEFYQTGTHDYLARHAAALANLRTTLDELRKRTRSRAPRRTSRGSTPPSRATSAASPPA